MNDFLSSTRTFELKQKVARLIKKHEYPMVLNVVLHRYNIDHVTQILEMAEQFEAEYVELANTQYYGWAFLNRDKLLPSREHGPVRLPDPPGGATDLQGALEAIAQEFAAGQRGSFA